MSEKPKGPKERQRRKSETKVLRDITIQQMAMKGAKVQDIADKVGLGRQRVSEILNSKETKDRIAQAESRITRMIDNACQVVEVAMEKAVEGIELGSMANGLKAALSVLETQGLIKKNVNIAHKFPKPTVIELRDGVTKLVVGAESEDE
jgi:predicted transcriptional regulator